MQVECESQGGWLKDGLRGVGQYCYLREDGVRYTFDQAVAKCAELSGSLPILKTLDEHNAFHNDVCSAKSSKYALTTKCTAVCY